MNVILRSNSRLALVRLVRRMVGVCALLTFAAVQLNAALWYVDRNASGANAGTNWANAWTSFTAIKWNQVQPGDTVYISGGANGSSKTYTGTLSVGKSGTVGNPITIAVKADDSAHNGTVYLGQAVASTNGNGSFGDGSHIELPNRQFIHFNGNVGGQSRFVIRNTYNTNNSDFANAIVANSSQNTKFDTITISNCNNGIRLSSAKAFTITNCTFRQMRGDFVIRANSVVGTTWDDNKIDGNFIEVVVNNRNGGGPDGIQTGNNMAIRWNTFTCRRLPTNDYTSGQHPDYIQAPGAYIWIEGNDFVNIGDSAVQLHGWFEGASHAHIRVINNLFRIVETVDPYPEYIRLYNVGFCMPEISDVIIANNVFADNPSRRNIYLIPDSPAGSNCNPTGSGNFLVNNLFINSSLGGAWELTWSTNWTANTWTIAGNVYSGSGAVLYKGTTYQVANWVSQFEPSGSTALPTFLSYTNKAAANNFHLAYTDTVATKRGTNLFAYFSTDRDGQQRAASGKWDSGAYRAPATQPVPEPPNTPSNVTPTNNSTSVAITPTLTASAYSDPAASPMAASQWQIFGTNGTTLVFDSGTADASTSYVVPANVLTYSLPYKWQVRYQNAANMWSAYSAQTMFTVTNQPAPNTPVNVAPLAGATNVALSPTLECSVYVDAQGSAHTDTEWTVYLGTNAVWTSLQGAVTSTTVGISLQANTTYTFAVRYKNALGFWSASSAATAFTTVPNPPTTPVNITPLSGATGVSLTPTLTISPYSDPASIPQLATEWVVNNGLLTVWTNLQTGSSVSAAIPPSTLNYSTLYSWQARVQNAVGLWSGWSSATTFTTTNAPVVPVTPTTNSVLVINGDLIIKGNLIIYTNAP